MERIASNIATWTRRVQVNRKSRQRATLTAYPIYSNGGHWIIELGSPIITTHRTIESSINSAPLTIVSVDSSLADLPWQKNVFISSSLARSIG